MHLWVKNTWHVCFWPNNSSFELETIQFCLPESFNTNISYQHFDYIITFVNLQHKNKNSKGEFALTSTFQFSMIKHTFISLQY